VSLHAVHVPTREELVRLVSDRPVSRTLKLASLVLAALGLAVFVFGALGGAEAGSGS
jgi:hypothetical protein